MQIKICGLSTPESVAVARDHGASHLGFIFFSKSPRNVTPKEAAELRAQAGSASTVAVTVDAEDAFLDTIVTTMDPDMLQLHGGENPERVEAVRARYGLPVIKALSVRDTDDLARARTYENVAKMLLLDAKPPKGSDLPGGNGVSFDWALLEGFDPTIPVFLSGGISRANLTEALAVVRGNNALVGLDLSSGVESAPGVKDIAEIAALLAACKQDDFP
jgi:phosphoribosylanthranilate isomerase